jgi:predicted O-methyltransferase YrrM
MSAVEYRAPDWDAYRMVYHDPHQPLEPLEREIAEVDQALAALRDAGVLPHTDYDRDKMLAMRAAVADKFEIPWTAITPRLQRLIYAVNAIKQPAVMLAAGCFCGNTFICNAGAAVGPGACYTAQALIGVEIKPDQAARAERNVRRLDATGVARVVAADAVDVVRGLPQPIDLLYLDADGKGKAVYLDILQAAYDRMPPGSLVLAHNSVNSAQRLAHYLAFVRDESNMRASVNVILDGEGLEVSVK